MENNKNEEVTLETIQMNVFNHCKTIEHCKLISCDTIRSIYTAIIRLISIFLYSLPMVVFIFTLFKKSIQIHVLLSIIFIVLFTMVLLIFMCKKDVSNMEKRYENIKIEIASIYFTQYTGYDKMEDWVRDKVFKDSILPYTGIQIMKTE